MPTANQSAPYFGPPSSIATILQLIRASEPRFAGSRRGLLRKLKESPVVPIEDDLPGLLAVAQADAAFQRPFVADSYTAEPGAAVRDDDELHPGCKKIVFRSREGGAETTYRNLPGSEVSDREQPHAVAATRDQAESRHQEQLASFKRLAIGWDGYSAPPPVPVVIAAARDFLSATAEFPPDRAAPSVVGGIGVTYRKNGRKVYVEFRNTGSILALFSDGTTEPVVEPVDPGEYPAFLTRARGYLGE